MPDPLLTMTVQRHPGDCGVAALAMYLRVSYEEALLATGDPTVLQSGIWFMGLVTAAQRLGITLKRRVRWSPDHDSGIALVKIQRGDSNHVVVMREGLLFDTNNYDVWHPEEYLQSTRRTFGSLLQRSDE